MLKLVSLVQLGITTCLGQKIHQKKQEDVNEELIILAHSA